MSNFCRILNSISKSNNSRIILALDIVPDRIGTSEDYSYIFNIAVGIIRKTANHIAGIKLNKHLVLPHGIYNPECLKIITEAHKYGLPIIMDEKIGDVGSTNKIISEYYYSSGVDAVTCNPFVGFRNGLDEVFKNAETVNDYNSIVKNPRGVILLVYMSNEGAKTNYSLQVFGTPLWEQFAYRACEWGADGVVIGANYPRVIETVKGIIDHSLIISPGITEKGDILSEALNSGMDYAIIGRAIINSEDPVEKTIEFKDFINDNL